MASNRKPPTAKRRLVAMISTTALVLALGSASFAQETSRDIAFDIEPQSLQAALLEFSEQAGIQLIIAANTRGLRLRNGVSGAMEPAAALAQLITGTDLEFRFTSENTVTIRKKVQPQPAIPISPQTAQKSQQSDTVPDAAIEEIVSTGTRNKGRTATQTPVPIDVVTASALAATGQSEVGRMLQTLTPSFNFSSSSVSDGTDALRPATLRGLGPDQTLVLVNGKRRHTSALVHVNTSVGRGAAGVDMNAIPGSALKRIEVLRDGAAAQYGSDAIAGVINLVLQDRVDGGEASISYGQTYEGDGATIVASANMGTSIGNGGFLNVTAEYRDRGDTNRAGLTGAVQYPLLDNGGACDAGDNSGCDPREFTFNRTNFRIGDADTESSSLVANLVIPFSDEGSFYAFATYTDRRNQSAGFYRRVSQYDRTVAAIYPDGFLPLINTNIEDYSAAAGLELEDVSGWNLDIGINHGVNRFQFVISNSLNASLGAGSPTEADAGTLFMGQTSLNIDAVRTVEVAGREASLALGAEFRDERYRIEAGEVASYANGFAVNTQCPGCDIEPVVYQSGFQVFRGFSPSNEVDADRHNISLYLDVESYVTDRLLLTGAFRFEDYSDFGDKVTGKLSARYDLNDALAFRVSGATGFRAPSMQQKNFNSVSTQFVDVGGNTVAQERGTFRNESEVARLLGVPRLKEETSKSFSAGFIATLGRLTLTADYYHIEINDRIGISGAIDLSQPGFEHVSGQALSGQFFVNAADTVTDGADLVATYNAALAGDQHLTLTASANWTNTRVIKGSLVSSIGGVDVGPLFSRQDVSIIEEWQPKSRMNLSANYRRGRLGLIARLSQYGSYTVCEGTCDGVTNRQTYGDKWLADVQASYELTKQATVTVGVNNLFDTTPDTNLIGQARAGTIKDIVSSQGVFQFSRRSAPFGFNGGYWYARAQYKF